MRLKQYSFAVVMSFAGAAHAQTSVEFMGVEMGAQFTMPECQAESKYGLTSYTLEQAVTPCWKHRSVFDAGKPLPDASFEVAFQPLEGKRPVGVTDALISVVDGKMVVVKALTDGIGSQDNIADALISKFGPPVKADFENVENRMGASFKKRTAEWKIGDVSVDFSGFVGRLDFGLVTVSTSDGHAYSIQQLKERRARQGSF